MTALSAALATDGIWLLFIGVALAGMVRGFAGFGTAMVYLPIAAQVLSPVWALLTMMLIDIIGPLPTVPRALRDGQPRDVLRLGAGALIGVPAGVAVLILMDPSVFRYAVSMLAAALLVLLASGFRYRGVVSRPMIYGTGGISGFLGGALGLAGPPVFRPAGGATHSAWPLPCAGLSGGSGAWLCAVRSGP